MSDSPPPVSPGPTRPQKANPTICDLRPWEDPTSTPFVEIDRVSKSFGSVRAVDDVSLAIHKGELFGLLGGSGSGKTTLLRILAGFETPDTGRVMLDGVDITRVPPHRRPVNMMFQSYALFPHMSVAKNIAYGLKFSHVSRAEMKERVADALDLVQLTGLGRRKPSELSGGQRQRVALARALVKRPKLLLLDEPLGALDRKLRENTQFELVKIQEDLGVTFLVVTHDQEEAMTLSTRIGVMDRGHIVQIGVPREVYERPTSRFVADFLGSVNLFAGVAHWREGHLIVETADGLSLPAAPDSAVADGEPVHLAVRPEKLIVERKRHGEGGPAHVLFGTVDDVSYQGMLSVLRIDLNTGQRVHALVANTERDETHAIEWGEEITVRWPPAAAMVLKS